MYTPDDLQDQANVAAREIQHHIEATQQQIVAARRDVLQLIEQQWIELPSAPAPQEPGTHSALDGQNSCPPEEQPTGQPCLKAQAQLAKVLHLMVQRSGRYAMEATTTPPSLKDDTTEAAIKIFDEVTQIFKEMSEPLLQVPLALQAEPQDLNQGAIEKGSIDAVPIEDAEDAYPDMLSFASSIREY